MLVGQAVQVPFTNSNPGGQLEQSPVVGLQLMQEAEQAVQVPLPATGLKVLEGQAEQVVPLSSNPALQVRQSPVVAVQVRQAVQGKQVELPADGL